VKEVGLLHRENSRTSLPTLSAIVAGWVLVTSGICDCVCVYMSHVCLHLKTTETIHTKLCIDIQSIVKRSKARQAHADIGGAASVGMQVNMTA